MQVLFYNGIGGIVALFYKVRYFFCVFLFNAAKAPELSFCMVVITVMVGIFAGKPGL